MNKGIEKWIEWAQVNQQRGLKVSEWRGLDSQILGVRRGFKLPVLRRGNLSSIQPSEGIKIRIFQHKGEYQSEWLDKLGWAISESQSTHLQ